MASIHWVPAGAVASLEKDEVSRALAVTTVWRLVATFILVEAAVWTPVGVRIPALLALMTLAILVHRVECRVLRTACPRISLTYELLFGALLVSGLAVGFAYFNGVLHPAFGSHTQLWFYPGYVVWAVFQELLLQGIFFVSLERLFGSRHAVLLSALLFSIAHIPNTFLMAATFIGGIIFSLVYAATRNLLVTGMVHALLGLALAVTAPAPLTHGMLVGLDYVRGRAFTGASVSTNINNSLTPTSMQGDKQDYASRKSSAGSTKS